MRRWWFLIVPMVVVMIAIMVPMGRAERFAVDPAAPWQVVGRQSMPAGTVDGVSVFSMSPQGTWLFGMDQTVPKRPRCFWYVETWERTCPELEPGEDITAAFAWSPDEASFVVPTYLPTDEAGGVSRLVRIDPASGGVTTLHRPDRGTIISKTTLSPESDRLALIQISTHGPITIQRMALDGGEPETILTASDAVTLSDADDLRWTAAGWLVFYSGPYASDTQGYWRVNEDGSGLERIDAITPGDLQTRILDISADGRLMIAQGVSDTDACGPDRLRTPTFVVDLEHDELVQVICPVYQRDMPGNRGTQLHPGTRAFVAEPLSLSNPIGPQVLPDGSVLALLMQLSGDDTAYGLGVIDVASGQLSVVSNDLHRIDNLFAVLSERDDGTVFVWAGGYWRDRLTLAPVDA